MAGPDAWKQKMAQCRRSPTLENKTEEVIVGLCHQRGNNRARKRRWVLCTSQEAGVLQAEGLAHLGKREEAEQSEWSVG